MSRVWVVRGVGLLTGIIIAVAVLASGRVPGGAGTVGADLTITAAPTGELDIPAGVVVHAGHMLPTGSEKAAVGSVPIRNQTGQTVDVFVGAVPSVRDLDAALRLELRAAGATLFDGPLERLRDGSTTPIVIASGQTVDLRIAAWVPEGARDYEGRIGEVALTFRTRPAEGAA